MENSEKVKKSGWGLVLGGGGGKGAFQIGVWRALIETGLFGQVGGIAGSSVGALNLVLMAYGDYALAHDIWSNIKPSQFLDVDISKIDLTKGLFKRDGLIELIDDYINLEAVSISAKELFITATECNKEGKGCDKIEYFKINGKAPEEIKEILLASSAMPYIYNPVNIDGVVYRDGGMQDNIPIKPLYEAGYRKIIIIPLSPVVEVDIAKFPDITFLTMTPSKNLGNLLSGTLDFTAEGSKERIMQGHKDAWDLFHAL